MEPQFRAGETLRDSYKKRTSTPVFALVLAAMSLLCIIGAIIIVYLSHDREVATWMHRPTVSTSVLLSIMIATFKTCQSLLVSYGIAILWWRTVLAGTSLKNLHYIWSRGAWAPDQIGRAWTAGSQTRWLMVVTGITMITNLSAGPLLQRSSKPILLDRHYNFTPAATFAAEIADGWTGTVDYTSPHANMTTTRELASVLKNWFIGTPLNQDGWCNDGSVCTGELIGAGIAANCSASNQSVSMFDMDHETTGFDLTFNRSADATGSTTLNMWLHYLAHVDSQCNATIVSQLCTIQPAKVAYPVTVRNGIISFSGDALRVVELLRASDGDLPGITDALPVGVLAGLEYFGSAFLHSNGSLFYNASQQTFWTNSNYGTTVNVYESVDPTDVWCDFHWDNATEGILEDMNEVMFRIALNASGRNNGLCTGY